ncbi:MAG: hypothetical protein BWY72_02089 [Bacteroidetes bacterium ADurb.Bin416]|nr:MAG: hypothetical protein BWY72_02089 [Bacteroidetes bacterium ADurb.Bin416]
MFASSRPVLQQSATEPLSATLSAKLIPAKPEPITRKSYFFTITPIVYGRSQGFEPCLTPLPRAKVGFLRQPMSASLINMCNFAAFFAVLLSPSPWTIVSKPSSKSGSKPGKPSKPTKLRSTPTNPSITYSTCFLIPQELACTSDILWATSPPISFPVTNASTALTYCTPWGMTPTVYQPNNTPYRQASTQPSQQPVTLPDTENSSTRSVFPLTGTGKCRPAILAITNGRSGLSSACTMPTTTTMPPKLNRLTN